MTYLKKYLNRLIGRADIEDALKALDRLTNEEFMMAVAQILKVVHSIQSGVEELIRKFDDGWAGAFSTSVTQKCHPKSTLHTTSRRGKESS